jgi:phospholipid transport system substrate-binding protein
MLASAAVAAFLPLAPLNVASAGEDVSAGAKATVQALADEGVALLSDRTASRAEQIARFRTLFNRYFAVDAIGKWVLGRYWSRATGEQQAEYRSLFESLITYGYVKRFSEYAGEQLAIVKVTAVGEGTASVFTEINRPGNAGPVHVVWRVGASGDRYMITDVVVENASLAQTWRADFAATLQQNGGMIAPFLDGLRDRVEALKAEVEANR